MPQTKATKKFEKKHLKGVLKRRKEFARVKQRVQTRERKKARRAEQALNSENEQAKDENLKQSANSHSQNLANMSVDEFFQSSVDVPEQPRATNNTTSLKSSAKRKRDGHIYSSQSDSESSEPNSRLKNLLQEDSDNSSDSVGSPTAHKEELEALAEKDPEFYKYLRENDAELLAFGENEELKGLGEGNEDSLDLDKLDLENSGSNDTRVKSVDKDQNEVTKSMVDRWRKAIEDRRSLKAAKELSLAFRAAVHPDNDGKAHFKYSISNPDVYHEVLILALKSLNDVLEHHIPKFEKGMGKVRIATESKNYRKISPLIKSHATSVLYLIKTLSDAATLKLTLHSLLNTLPYIMSYKKLVRELLNSMADIWSDLSNTEATRIAAFLIIRNLMVNGDRGTREAGLRATYQGLVKNSRKTTMRTVSGINLMKNSAAELWGIDPNIGYTSGFTFIRQLAIHLRSTIKKNSNDSYRTIYNWQFVHSLDFWSRTVSMHCDTLREATSGKEHPFRSLIYPIVQITLGTMRLIPNSQYFPLRFHLIRSLLRISLTTNTYIPLAPALYEVLTSAEMRKPPKPSTLKALDFDLSIKASNSFLRTRIYQDGVGEEVVGLLSDFFTLWTKSIAFPELALPVVFMLKRWLKQVSGKDGNKNGKVNSAISLLVQKLEANSRWIEEHRATVNFAPNNRAGVEGFLKDIEWDKTPLGAFVAAQRKLRGEKAKILAEGREQDMEREDMANGQSNRASYEEFSDRSDEG